MLTKANVGTILTFIAFFSISDASAMLTRLRPLTRTNKVNLRKYSTKEPKDLRKLAARQFVLKDPLSISTMYTLLTHNKEKFEGLQMIQVYPLVGIVFSSLDLVSSIFTDNCLLFSPLHITVPIGIGSIACLYALKDPLNKRKKLVNILEEGFSSGKISLPDMHYIQNVAQEDIAAKINYLNIIPTKNISHFGKKDEALQYKWDINDSKILKDTLDGKYNSSDYVLYLQQKE